VAGYVLIMLRDAILRRADLMVKEKDRDAITKPKNPENAYSHLPQSHPFPPIWGTFSFFTVQTGQRSYTSQQSERPPDFFIPG